MDSATLVEESINDGQRLIDRLSDRGFKVLAACWVKPTDDDRRSLYIASPLVDEKGIMEAYRQFLEIFRSLDGLSLTSSEIKLIGEKNPITRDLADFRSSSSGTSWSVYRKDTLGGLFVEDVYLYSPNPFTVTIYGMTFDGDPTGLIHLSLEPHNPTTRFIVGTPPDCHEYQAKIGKDWIVAAPEGSSLERNDIGLMSLAWNFRGQRVRSSANAIWSYAKLELNGFRFLSSPE